ncbi:hypothetical protein QAD02_016177 [Eretmocerus hayati]|uniref:Uncharacterized protein n=1 Tax=Eretmocerus hayati TaxID=131215 RepID=A0ACC2PAF1_9HYME|nr:hypothetical protein QAD02_016177 [Eretmocerus hayati]
MTGLSLNEFFTKCVRPTGDVTIDQAPVLLCKGAADVTDEREYRIVHEHIVENHHRLPCRRISCSPAYGDSGLFTITKEDCVHEFVDNLHLLSSLTEQQDLSFYDKTDAEIVDLMPNLQPGLYSSNILGSNFCFGLLDQCEIMVESNVDPATNPDVGEMDGINRSMFYLSGPRTYSEMHREDGDTASAVVVYCNTYPNSNDLPAKLWVVALEPMKLERAVRKTVSAESTSRKGEKKRVSRKNIKHRHCVKVLDHKDTYITIKFLEAHGIKYVTVRQYPKDALYVRHGYHHQVIQLTPNLMEARNYGDFYWNQAPLPTYCTCGEGKLVSIAKNRRAVPNKGHFCEDCTFQTSTKVSLVRHYKDEHGKDMSTPQVRKRRECPDCGTQTFRLDDHLRKQPKKHRDAVATQIARASNPSDARVVQSDLVNVQGAPGPVSMVVRAPQAARGSVSSHVPAPVWCCRYCNATFPTKPQLVAHEPVCTQNRVPSSLRPMLREPVPPTNVERCAFCNGDFLSGEIVSHRRTCDAKSFKCGHCPKTYNRKYYRDNHVRRDHPSV